jgi:putative colanic acid biosynthesis acetyltransferase WcaB
MGARVDSVRALRADYRANRGYTKGLLLVLSYRLTSAVIPRGQSLPSRIVRLVLQLPYIVFVEWGLGFDLPPVTRVGPGLQVFHGQCVVVHPRCVLGSNVSLRHGCTLGTAMHDPRDEAAAPLIGDGVFLGAGCTVLGGVVVGDDAVIGAGAVVTRDVPAGAVAVGVPARVIRYRDTDLDTRAAPAAGEDA